jgi:hypothetical protein
MERGGAVSACVRASVRVCVRVFHGRGVRRGSVVMWADRHLMSEPLMITAVARDGRGLDDGVNLCCVGSAHA